MAPPLLQTKLYIPPPRPELVPRPRLVERLNAGLHRKLTLISAPAGFGKTTLLSEWIHCRDAQAPPLQVAWLSLDEGDNDLTRFLTYLLTALQTIDDGNIQGLLATLQSPNPIDHETVLTLLLNELAGRSERVVLVLDDYHTLDDASPGSAAIDQALAFLLDHLPPAGGLHLVIASRTDPALPLSRLRARGQLTELRTADLRFRGNEIDLFLQRVVGLSLLPDDLRTLEDRTEGWITGLQLAALALQSLARQTAATEGPERQEQIASFVQSFGGSHRYVIDYLVDEVLEQLAPGMQAFLLQTSVLDRLTADLCDSVTEGENSQSLLEQLEAANLFLIPLDGERRWYRYHHLFAELLRQRLCLTRPGQVSALHSRASEWYAAHDSPLEAVQHAFASGDLEQAADRIEAAGLPTIGQGAFSTVRTWIEALPVGLVRRRPYLSVYHAWTSSFTHQLDAIEPFLEQARGALRLQGSLPDGAGVAAEILGHIATLRAWSARRQRDNAQAIALLTEAAGYLGHGDPFVRTFAALNLGLAHLDDGTLNQAARSLREAASQGEAAGNELAVLTATSYLGAVLILQGRLHEAAQLLRQAIQDHLARYGKPHPTCCLVYLRLAWVLAEWNDIDGFYANLSQAVRLAHQIRYDAVVKSGSLSMAWEKQLLAGQGRVVELPDDVAAIVEQAVAGEVSAAATAPVLESQNTEAYLADDAYFEIWPGYSDHARARELAQTGRQQEALDLLAQVYHTAQRVEGIGQMIEARSSQALIYQSQGRLEPALEALENALALSESEGYVRTYVDRDEPMKKLLQQAADRGIKPGYTAKLLAAFKAAPPGKGRTPSQHPALVEPLSPRELEVLRLVAQGLSNREIAERLYLALSTIKGYNRNIYGKLQVQRRTEAVARARELGLL